MAQITVETGALVDLLLGCEVVKTGRELVTLRFAPRERERFTTLLGMAKAQPMASPLFVVRPLESTAESVGLRR